MTNQCETYTPGFDTSGDVNTLTFTDSANTPLDANTGYALKISDVDRGFGLVTTSSLSEDTGAAQGWSIGNDNLQVAAGMWVPLSGGINRLRKPFQVSVTGNTLSSAPSLSVAGGASATEGDALSYTVTLSPAAHAEVTVDYEVLTSGTNDTASSSDLSGTTSGTLTFAAGDTTKTITVNTAQDDVHERDETFTLKLMQPCSNGRNPDEASAMSTIENDDDVPKVTLTLADAQIREADDPGTASVEEHKTTVTASLSRPSSEATTVTVLPVGDVFTVSGGGVITIPAGQTSSTDTVTITAVNNLAYEPNKMATVSATAANDLDVTDPDGETLTIIDDEEAAAGTLRLVGGEVEHEGRLEMYYNGQWGTICDDYWTEEDEDVACKQLGYSEGSEGQAQRLRAQLLGSTGAYRFRPTYFGAGSGPIHLDDVLCNGNETSLLMCPRVRNKPVGKHNCRHREDVGVRCAADSPRISEAPALSGPGGDGRWGPGETLEVTVTFSENMRVDTSGGAPSIEVRLGSSTKRRAVYDRGDGSAELVFAYELQPDDGTHVTAHVSGDSLKLGGGHIRSRLSGRDAILDHAGASIAGEAATAPALTAEFTNLPASHMGPGRPFTFELHFSHNIKMSYRTVRDDLLSMRARVDRARRLTAPSNMGWEITVSPISYDDIVMTLPATADCTSETAVCTSTGQKLETGISALVPGIPAASVADAEVHEGPDATLDFVVTLTRPAERIDAVRYRTVDGTARAGEDYEAKSSLLYFEEGVSVRTVSVPVFDDAVDEGSETMHLELSEYPHGGRLSIRIADGTAIGTINNDDPMPKAWMVRFARTVGAQVVDALAQRLEGGGGSHVTVAGINVVGAPEVEPEPEPEDDDPFGLPEWATEAGREADARGITAADLLLGSAFHLSSVRHGAVAGPAFSAWGRVATGGFEAEEDGVTMDGDVTTGFVGFDAEWERLLAGVMLSQSEGEGSYRLDAALGTDGGTVESSLTGVYPYARADLSARVSAWALAGAGSGELTLKREGRRDMATDISMRMGAVGVKGRVLDGTGPSGLAMNVKSDAMWVGTKSEDTDELAPSEGDVTRLRLMVEGERVFESDNGATFTPSAELGLRHDAGDAETGTGVEAGAGLRYSAGALTVEGRVRALVAHEATGYKEWGASGAIRMTPDASGRGLTLSIAPQWGRTASATGQLWSVRDAAELERDSEFEATGRLAMDAGYGFGLGARRGVLTPYAGMTLGDGDSRTVRGGARWQWNPDAVFGLEASQQSIGAEGPANEVRLRAALRF